MLYLLLIIIAVGVLLASEEGQGLLDFLTILLIIGDSLYLGFWFFKNIYKGFKNGNYSIQNIWQSIKNIFIKDWWQSRQNWKQLKIVIISLILVILLRVIIIFFCTSYTFPSLK